MWNYGSLSVKITDETTVYLTDVSVFYVRNSPVILREKSGVRVDGRAVRKITGNFLECVGRR